MTVRIRLPPYPTYAIIPAMSDPSPLNLGQKQSTLDKILAQDWRMILRELALVIAALAGLINVLKNQNNSAKLDEVKDKANQVQTVQSVAVKATAEHNVAAAETLSTSLGTDKAKAAVEEAKEQLQTVQAVTQTK